MRQQRLYRCPDPHQHAAPRSGGHLPATGNVRRYELIVVPIGGSPRVRAANAL